MFFITHLHQRFQVWKEKWFGTLGHFETAIGVEYDRFKGVYQVWTSYDGLHLFWLSGHHTQEGAEAVLPRVQAWAERQDRVDPLKHAVELALLRDIGDFRAEPPSERIQAAILQRIKERDPAILIVDSTPDEDEYWLAMEGRRQGEPPSDEWLQQVDKVTDDVNELAKVARRH